MPKKVRSKMDKSKAVSVLDVAAYILEKQPKNQPITAWKLQKLVYYCQAWSLVWDEQVLFKEKIIAWANGPVIKELYEQHRGQFTVVKLQNGIVDHLTSNQKDTIDHVVMAYGEKTAQWLSDLTHIEFPWIEAREALSPGERGKIEIKLATMHEYYSSIGVEHQINS